MNDIQISKASRWFFVILFLLLFISVAATYYRYMIIEDYEVFLEFDEEGNPINIEE